jgi:putative transposase
MRRSTPPYKTWGKSRSVRLKEFDYTSPFLIYHIIIGAAEKQNIFTDPTINLKVIETLKNSAELYGYKLLSYCLMSDHLHILVQATESPKDLRSFVRGFKSFSTKSTRKNLWQRSFYEHILRREENAVDVANYILNNPVRKGLVEEYKQYKWCKLIIDSGSVASLEATNRLSSKE